MTKNDLDKSFIELRDRIIESRYNKLNSMQREAVLTSQGPVLVLAGAGSGKTTVLTNRVAHIVRYGDVYASPNMPSFSIDLDDIELLKSYYDSSDGNNNISYGEIRPYLEYRGVFPSKILAITFTNKAAKEMKTRIHDLIGDKANDIWVYTFHSACARILRTNIDKIGYGKNFVIYDDTDQLTVVKECLKQLNLSEKYYNPKVIRAKISSLKNELKSPDDYSKEVVGDFSEETIAKIYTLYEKILKSNNALDFDDLLIKTLELFYLREDVLNYYREKFEYILVDEYQDTNYAQYMLVKLLSDRHKNLCVVGDDDQSIYRWRGADIRNILEFEKDFPQAKIVKLEQNYRSHQNILDAAYNVIKNNSKRKDKRLWTQKPGGEKIKLYKADDEHREADFICRQINSHIEKGGSYEDIAILYRMNAQSRVLEESLMKYGLRYEIYGGLRFYDRMEIKDIIAYLRVLDNPRDDVSLERIINVPRRGIGDTSLDKLKTLAQDRQDDLFNVILDFDESVLGRSSSRIREFALMMNDLINLKDKLSLTDFLEELLDKTTYLESLVKENSMEAMSRIDNIKEFVSAVNEFEENNPDASLTDFLEGIALVADIDRMDTDEDGDTKSISLMTMHSAKGLEFPIVFITGLEEGLFPHSRSMDSEEELEEERRLCYVGVTRAKEQLYLTHTASRRLYGNPVYNMPSRFLKEIPRDLLDDLSPSGFSTTFNRANTISRAESEIRPSGRNLLLQHKQDSVVRPVKKENSRFNLGDRVHHSKFGNGTIVAVKGNGEDMTLQVAFLQGGIKNFLASLAPLKKI